MKSKELYRLKNHRPIQKKERYLLPSGLGEDVKVYAEYPMDCGHNHPAPLVQRQGAFIYLIWDNRSISSLIPEITIYAGEATQPKRPLSLPKFSIKPKTMQGRVLLWAGGIALGTVFYAFAVVQGWSWALWIDDNLRVRVMGEKLVAAWQSKPVQQTRQLALNDHPIYQSTKAKKYHKETGIDLQKYFWFIGYVEEGGGYDLFIERNITLEKTHGAAKKRCRQYPFARLPVADELDKINLLQSTVIETPQMEWTATSRGWVSDDYQIYLPPGNLTSYEEDLVKIEQINVTSPTADAELTKLSNQFDIDVSAKTFTELKYEVLGRFKDNFFNWLPQKSEIENHIVWLDGDETAPSRCAMIITKEDQ